MFIDSSFKADTEIKLLENLKQLPYVTFLSATPILDKYLNQIDFFDDIAYYKLEWVDKYKVQVHGKKTNNPIGVAQNIGRITSMAIILNFLKKMVQVW